MNWGFDDVSFFIFLGILISESSLLGKIILSSTVSSNRSNWHEMTFWTLKLIRLWHKCEVLIQYYLIHQSLILFTKFESLVNDFWWHWITSIKSNTVHLFTMEHLHMTHKLSITPRYPCYDLLLQSFQTLTSSDLWPLLKEISFIYTINEKVG